jgi:hypothetical protein
MLRVGLSNNGRMSGRVDLGNDIDAPCGRVGRDILDIFGRIDLLGRVRALLGELSVAWNDQREGLGVDDMPVELVHLHPGHGVKRALDIGDGEAEFDFNEQYFGKEEINVLVTGRVEHESTVRLRRALL